MERVQKYPADYSKPVLKLLKYLAKVNIKLYDHESSWFRRNWRFFYMFPIMVAHLIALSAYLIRRVFIEGRNVYSEASTMPIFIVTFQAIIKGIVVMCNKYRLENVIDGLGQVWRTRNLNDVQKAYKKAKAKEIRVAEIGFLRLTEFTAWQFVLLPIAQTLIFNVLLGRDDEMRLPFNSWHPVDPSSSWTAYGVIYAFQFYSIFMLVYLYIGPDFSMVVLSTHLSGEFLLLREDLKNIKPTKNVDYELNNGYERICKFIQSHQKLIALVQELDAAVNQLMFFNLLFTTINFAFFGLASLAAKAVGDKLTNAIVVMCVLNMILVLCYFCDNLQSASAEISRAASENLWYEGDVHYRRLICLITLRSQKPCYITSLSYRSVTLETFTWVLRVAWSYFSLMNNMYEDSRG